MSKIAKKFDLTVEQLMAANPKIKNPNKIDIGDEITIPVPEPETGPGRVGRALTGPRRCRGRRTAGAATSRRASG